MQTRLEADKWLDKLDRQLASREDVESVKIERGKGNLDHIEVRFKTGWTTRTSISPFYLETVNKPKEVIKELYLEIVMEMESDRYDENNEIY